MKVRDMFTKDFEKYGDIDICDDVIDDYYPTFCPPTCLTKEGEGYFDEVLEVEFEPREDLIILCIDEYPDWKRKRRVLTELFEAVAGYVPEEIWNKWFYYPDHPAVPHFCDDEEKMRDFVELSKDEFLQSYSYLTEAEYEATRTEFINRVINK